MASPPRCFAGSTGTKASTAMAVPVTEEVDVVFAPLTAAAVASLNVRQAPVTATEAGLMVVAVEPMLCTPVQPGGLNLSPPRRSGTSEFSCGGPTAAGATPTPEA